MGKESEHTKMYVYVKQEDSVHLHHPQHVLKCYSNKKFKS